MTSVEDKYISLDDAADYLGVKPATIRAWLKSKNMPGHRIGKLWKFKKNELDEWINSGKSAI